MRFALLNLALVLAATSTPAGAAPPDAVATVQKTLDAALEIAHAPGSRDEHLASLRTIVRDILDTQAMGRHAIGDALAAQSPARQKEYFALFDELIVRAYLQKLLLFRDPHFDYGQPRSAGDVVVVPTHIVTAKDEYRVEYAMRQRDGHWAAIDVLVEGVSLTDNYRSQFATLLRDRSFAELLDLLRAKTRPGAPS